MKLLIAAVTFAATLGMLFLIETGKSPKEDSARIIEALKEGNASAAVSATPSPIKVRTPTPTPVLTPLYTPTPAPTRRSDSVASQTPTPIPTQTSSPIPTPAPIQAVLSQPSPTLSPSPSPTTTPTPIPITNHIFYTSRLACSRSKYVYCDTDKNWKDLVNPLSFATLDEALAACPNKTLHEPCK